MQHLEKRTKSASPQDVESKIVDAMFFLHLQKELPVTFKAISIMLFRKLVGLKGKVIHYVSDKQVTPSIKDVEHKGRQVNEIEMQYYIGGAQNRATNWGTTLGKYLY